MLEVLRERDFRLLWLGQATSAFGSSLVPVALAFAVIDLTGSPSALGVVLSAGLGSRICLLLLGGVVADRMPRQHVMVAADALRATTQGVVAVLLLSGTARVWELLVLFALYGAGDSFFSPASTGLVPETVSAAHLQQANSLLSLGRDAARVSAPALAGVIVAVVGPGVAFAADAATFVVSAVSLALLHLPAVVGTGERSGLLADLRGGWRQLTSRSWVWLMIVKFSVSSLVLAPYWVLGPFVAQRELGGAAAWGAIGTCGAVGAVLGSAVALRVTPWRPLFTGCLAVSLSALAPALLARPFPTAAIGAAAAVGFGAVSFSDTLWFTALQERIPPASLSRVSSYDWLGSLILQPAGYALAAPAEATIGIAATLLVGAGVQASTSIGIALTPAVRGLRIKAGPEKDAEELGGRPGVKSEAGLVSPARSGS
jgi:MFS family permease